MTTLLFLCFTVGFFLGRSHTGPAITVSVDSSLRTEPKPVTTDPTLSESAASELSFPVNLNTAGLGELMALPGVGETIARRILDYRSQHGPFESVMDLMNVEGIGEKTMEQLLQFITTGG